MTESDDGHRLEEFLRRRSRLQRVQETVRRNIVIGFFDTMYWSRRFRREVNLRRDSRMGGPPQLSVPEIFIDDPDDAVGGSESTEPRDFTAAAPLVSSWAGERVSTSSSFSARGVTPIDTTLRKRDSIKSVSPTTPDHQSETSPRTSAGRLRSLDTSYQGADGANSPVRPSLGHSRQGSGVNAQDVLESFDNSAWGESLRRSFTMRRPRSPRQ